MLEGQVLMEEMCLLTFLKTAKDTAARIELGRPFHQQGTVKVKVCENVFVHLLDDTKMHHSLT